MHNQALGGSVISGVYAITPSNWPLNGLLECVEAALSSGIHWVQYRDKTRPDEQRHFYACSLAALLERYRAHLIVNDCIDVYLSLLAAGYKPAGCHLGKDDIELAEARTKLGFQPVLGASCYGDLQRAQIACAQGASYVAFGALFASSTKPQAKIVNLGLIEQAVTSLAVPVVGIGGIDEQNIASVACAGAHAVAVVSSLFGEVPDPDFTLKQAKHLRLCFDEGVDQRQTLLS